MRLEKHINIVLPGNRRPDSVLIFMERLNIDNGILSILSRLLILKFIYRHYAWIFRKHHYNSRNIYMYSLLMNKSATNYLQEVP